MRTEREAWPRWMRGLLLACVAVLGIVAIVGSGGGGIGFPPCDAPNICSNGPPPPPLPTASVRPAYITALVGAQVSFTAESSNTSGSLSYQWHRSSDGGATFVDIVGATGKSYTLAGVNLGDDGAAFAVTVRSGNGIAHATAHLTVSAVPGLVFQDGEFLPADWLVSAVADSPATAPVHSEERIASGGNPGAFWRMVSQVPQGTGSARVFFTSPSATYEPQSQGAIKVIDYAEDCIALQNSDTIYAESRLVIEQAGRRFLSDTSGTCTQTVWSAVPSRASLRAEDFYRFDGPACQAGESCPDFSVNGLPMRFGFWRIAWGVGGDSIAHGIDNWKVTVWRR